MRGPSLTATIRPDSPPPCSVWQILPEIRFASRLISPQPCAEPLRPRPNDCVAWNPHGGMPLPRGIPLPLYVVHHGPPFPSAAPTSTAGPAATAKQPAAHKQAAQSIRRGDTRGEYRRGAIRSRHPRPETTALLMRLLLAARFMHLRGHDSTTIDPWGGPGTGC